MRDSQPEALVLISLLDGPKHGYAIADDLEALTRRRPGPGTLYGAIARLENGGLIARKASRDRRKPYALTRLGVERAVEELGRLESVAREGRRRLRLREAT
jgi:DNA-binding PadR family transcriptional regulator